MPHVVKGDSGPGTESASSTEHHEAIGPSSRIGACARVPLFHGTHRSGRTHAEPADVFEPVERRLPLAFGVRRRTEHALDECATREIVARVGLSMQLVP